MQYSLGNMLKGGGALNPDGLALDLAFALDRSFTTDPAAAGNALITSRRGPAAKFSRGSGATQVNAAGLIEYAPENLLLRSQDQSNTATWPALNSATREANSSLGLDGTQSATKIIFGSLASSLIFQGYTAPSTVNTPLTLSIWVSSTNAKKFRLAIFAASQSYSADLTATPTLTRYSFTVANPNATGINAVIANESAGGVGEIVIWGAQLERASTARTYYPTTTSVFYGPRFDHDPATGVCKGLLIEESRTNLVPRSSNFPAGSWGINAARLTWALDATGPDGLLSATTLTTTGIAGGAFIVSPANIASGTTYTQFAILKAGSAGFGAISSYDGVLDYGAMFNLATGVFVGYRTGAGTGTPISNNVESLGNGWWKVSMTYIATGTSSSFAAQILVSETGNLNFATTQSAGKTMIAFAYQLEVGAFPTSYIPTTSGTAARSADVCSIIGTDFASFYNQSEGTLFADATPPTVDQTAVVVGVNTTASTSSHFIYKIRNDFNGNGKRWGAQTVSTGAQTAIITSTDVAVSRASLSYAYKLNDFAFAYNGTIVGTDNTGTIPTPTAFRIGSRDNGLQINGHIARIQYFRKRLSNAKLQTLTAP